MKKRNFINTVAAKARAEVRKSAATLRARASNTIPVFHSTTIPKEIRWDAEIWMEFFNDTLLARIDHDTPIDPSSANRLVNESRLLADRCLEEIHDRWPGIRV